MPIILKKSSILCLSFFLFSVYPCANIRTQWKGSIITEQGVTVVRNPQKSLFSDDYLKFEEELLIPESDGKNYIFTNLSSLVLDENRNIYVLDIREANITVFNEHGKFLRSFGRKGEGPGELDVPDHMDIFRRNEITVKDAGNRRITFYSLDGEYIRSLSTARFSSRDMKIDSKGNIFCIVNVILDGQQRRELQKFDSNFNYIKTIDYMNVPVEKELAFFYGRALFCHFKRRFDRMWIS